MSCFGDSELLWALGKDSSESFIAVFMKVNAREETKKYPVDTINPTSWDHTRWNIGSRKNNEPLLSESGRETLTANFTKLIFDVHAVPIFSCSGSLS